MLIRESVFELKGYTVKFATQFFSDMWTMVYKGNESRRFNYQLQQMTLHTVV